MRRVVIANTSELPSQLKLLMTYFGTISHKDHGTNFKLALKSWSTNREKETPEAFRMYERALAEGQVEWVDSAKEIPGTYSVNAYRAGRKGSAARLTEPCWRLIECDKKKSPVTVEKSPLYNRVRYLWKNHHTQFGTWETGFVKSIGELLARNKPLRGNQGPTLEKILKKYKIPEDATASSTNKGETTK
jgi:hypothetical protein